MIETIWSGLEKVTAILSLMPAIGIVGYILGRLSRTGRGGWRYAWLLAHRRSRVRFSSSAVLTLTDKTNRYLMIFGQSPTGPLLTPVGGVLKSFPSARPKLRDFEARIDAVADYEHDLEADLRLYMPIKRFRAFLGWYEDGEGRESRELALTREMYEELPEAGLALHEWFNELRLPLSLDFSAPPLIFRDPKDPGLWHYRQFVALELEEPVRTSMLAALSGTPVAGTAFVSRDEILARRHDETRIGFHSQVLLRQPIRVTSEDFEAIDAIPQQPAPRL